MRIVVLALWSLAALYAADKLTLGKPAPHFADTNARTLVVFEALGTQAQEQLKGMSIRVRAADDAAVKQRYGVTPDQRVAVLVDEGGMLRRVIRRTGEDRLQFTSTLIREMRAWDDGKAIYDGQCARCHGEDGNGRNYPNIKTLGGIGNRLTEPEIAERTGQVGTVDLTVLGERVKSLAAYVAGL